MEETLEGLSSQHCILHCVISHVGDDCVYKCGEHQQFKKGLRNIHTARATPITKNKETQITAHTVLMMCTILMQKLCVALLWD